MTAFFAACSHVFTQKVAHLRLCKRFYRSVDRCAVKATVSFSAKSSALILIFIKKCNWNWHQKMGVRLMFFVILSNCALFVLVHGQELNLFDQCQVARSGLAGVCRFYEDCPLVLKELLEQGLTPTRCGSKDRKEIICCPVPPTPKPTVTTQPSKRISAKSKQKIPKCFCSNRMNNQPYTHKPAPIIINLISFSDCIRWIECVEYQEAVNERVYSTQGLSGPPVEQKVFRCAISSVPLIVGGTNALPKEFPHMVRERFHRINIYI